MVFRFISGSVVTPVVISGSCVVLGIKLNLQSRCPTLSTIAEISLLSLFFSYQLLIFLFFDLPT